MTRDKIMKVIVGSMNPCKIEAVKETLQQYDFLREATVEGKEVISGVPDQPFSMNQTVTGALNRAKDSYEKDSYSIGLESGLIKLPYDGKQTLFCFSVAVIYDGTKCTLGISSFFELPPAVKQQIDLGKTLNDAAKFSGLTKEEQISKTSGVVGLLTNGRISRKQYTQQALTMALIQLENRNWY